MAHLFHFFVLSLGFSIASISTLLRKPGKNRYTANASLFKRLHMHAYISFPIPHPPSPIPFLKPSSSSSNKAKAKAKARAQAKAKLKLKRTRTSPSPPPNKPSRTFLSLSLLYFFFWWELTQRFCSKERGFFLGELFAFLLACWFFSNELLFWKIKQLWKGRST